MRITTLPDARCGLGEGPVWDASAGCLYWVDSLAPALYRYRLGDAAATRWPLPGKTVGSLAVCASGKLMLAMGQGFYRFDPADASLACLARPLAGRDHIRFNDGKVDPFGNFIAGTMNLDASTRPDGELYRLGGDGRVSRLLDGFFCCNGPCFSADGKTLYVTGRREGVIEAFDYARHGKPRQAREFAQAPNPDGATVDAEGYLWSAQWDAHCLLRFAPDGNIDRQLDLAGQVVTSVMFGGPDLDLMFVTTLGTEAWHTRPESDQAGATLMISDSGYRGRPEPVLRD
ncbi:MAG: SMP-30/gluconolactonase/LRE family protein [Gammaproteobacteria bacterium]|nr:SMP-30/gluconolactonase/LRE family protein [Gammaproteobacteria bacterium]